MTSFEKFGDSFQSKIIYNIITDSDFALQVLEVLDPSFFSNDSYTQLTKHIIEWNEKYSTIPSFDNLMTIVKTKYDDIIEQEYLVDLVKSIRELKTTVSDKKFVEDETIEFCKQQAMRNAILTSVDLLKKEDYGAIYSVIQDAMQAGQKRDIGHDYFDSIDARLMDRRDPIGMGLPLLDDYIAGGLAANELGIILAGTGVGKSMVLTHIAAEALKQGKKVVYYTLELSDKMVGLRMDSKLTGIPLTRLITDIDGKLRSRVKDALNVIKNKTGHNPGLIIKEYPTKSASITSIKNHLLTLQNKNFIPDMIIVDYADLLKPTSRYSDKRFELEGIIEQLRGLAGEMRIPVWTASQTNRDGLDTSVVGLKNISESLGKAMVADLIISVGRSQRLIDEGLACWYIAKSRLGQDKVTFTGIFDTSTLHFTIDNEGLDESEVRTADNQNTMNTAVANVLANRRRTTALSDLLGEV